MLSIKGGATGAAGAVQISSRGERERASPALAKQSGPEAKSTHAACEGRKGNRKTEESGFSRLTARVRVFVSPFCFTRVRECESSRVYSRSRSRDLDTDTGKARKQRQP